MKDQKQKANIRLNINLRLLTVSFAIFALTISLNISLFKENILVPMQLVLTIPLLMTSIFARSRLVHSRRADLWEKFGFLTFVISYAFLINVVGILISITLGSIFGLVFLFFNIFMAMSYSIFEVIEERAKITSRILKDLFFAFILLFGGILPSLKVY
jgi:hypothetical protein